MTTKKASTKKTAKGKAKTGAAKPAATNSANNKKKANRRGPYSTGVQRRQELLEAALRIVAEEGATAVTHRAVAKEAGTSLGPTTYHFESKEEMVREAMRYFTTKGLGRMAQAAKTVRVRKRLEFDDAVDIMVDIQLAEIEAGETSTELQIALASSREPSFAPEYEAYNKKIEEYLFWMLSFLGSRCPEQDARIIICYMRGFGMEQLSRPHAPIKRPQFREDVARLLACLLGRQSSQT
ncbi:MAG: TetR family transcriptional regulator [Myxococcota bacterium]|nr:TetR family transcriptional regulator [Myxococcota bacterium]